MRASQHGPRLSSALSCGLAQECTQQVSLVFQVGTLKAMELCLVWSPRRHYCRRLLLKMLGVTAQPYKTEMLFESQACLREIRPVWMSQISTALTLMTFTGPRVFFQIPVHTLLQLSLVLFQSFCDNFSPAKAISNLGCYKRCAAWKKENLTSRISK